MKARAVLANLSRAKLTDSLRDAMLIRDLPESIADWIDLELAGYPVDFEGLPEYRSTDLPLMITARSMSERVNGVHISLHALPEYLRTTHLMVFGTGVRNGLPELLTLEGSERMACLPEWTARLRYEASKGNVFGLNPRVLIEKAWVPIPVSVAHRIAEGVKTRLVKDLRPIAQCEPEGIESARAAVEAGEGTISVLGDNNQIMVASPLGAQQFQVSEGDLASLVGALQKLGVDAADIADLSRIISTDTETGNDETKLGKALAWSQSTAKTISLGSAGSILASMILKFFGLG